MFHAIDLLRTEAEMIAVDQSRISVFSIHELVAERRPDLGLYGNQIAYRTQAVLFRELLFHRKRVRVVESQRSRHRETHIRQGLPDLVERFQFGPLENG